VSLELLKINSNSKYQAFKNSFSIFFLNSQTVFSASSLWSENPQFTKIPSIPAPIDALKGDEKKIFESGNIILNGEEKPLKPAKLTILNDKLVHLEIVEGKYHQVKRMFAYTGNKVVKLHRLEFAGFRVDDLKEGEFRVIEDKF
jgi:hypothetical protein